MDFIEIIVTKILEELTNAQDAVNKKSAELAEEYQNPPKDLKNLSYFPVPNSLIKSFDFSLNFGIEELGSLLTDKVKDAVAKICAQNWDALLGKLISSKLINDQQKTLLQENTAEMCFKHEKIQLTGTDLALQISETIIIKYKLRLKDLNIPSSVLNELLIAQQNIIENELRTILPDTLEKQKANASEFKAVFDINKLNEINNDIICGINVKVEMRNFDWTYIKEAADEKSSIKQAFLNQQ